MSIDRKKITSINMDVLLSDLKKERTKEVKAKDESQSVFLPNKTKLELAESLFLEEFENPDKYKRLLDIRNLFKKTYKPSWLVSFFNYGVMSEMTVIISIFLLAAGLVNILLKINSHIISLGLLVSVLSVLIATIIIGINRIKNDKKNVQKTLNQLIENNEINSNEIGEKYFTWIYIYSSIKEQINNKSLDINLLEKIQGKFYLDRFRLEEMCKSKSMQKFIDEEIKKQSIIENKEFTRLSIEDEKQLMASIVKNLNNSENIFGK